MNEEISRWVIDFLVRQPIDDGILDSLLSTLPLRRDESRLRKPLLLRRIRSEISNGSVSEKILDLLELVMELDSGDERGVSESMKMAYCAVAVDCTVRFLDEEVEKSGKYLEATKRIWRVRVGKLEKENSGMICGRLLRWRDDLEAAMRDCGMCAMILSRNTRNEALRAVKNYLVEAWSDLGPSFLEKIAENMDEMGRIGRGGSGDRRGGQVSEIAENGAKHRHVMDDGDDTVSDGHGGRERLTGQHNLCVDGMGRIGHGGTGDQRGGHDSEITKSGAKHHHAMNDGDDAVLDGNAMILDGHGSGETPRGQHHLSVDESGDQRGSQDMENAVGARDGTITTGGLATNGDATGMKFSNEHNISAEKPDHQMGRQVSKIGENGHAIAAVHRPARNGDGSEVMAHRERNSLADGPPVDDEETQRVVQVAFGDKYVTHSRMLRRTRPAMIADPDEVDEDICVSKNNGVSQPEVSGVQEGLHSRSKEPESVEMNPLSDTNGIEKPGGKGILADDVDDAQQKHNNVEDTKGNEVNPGRTSLMDRKPSAHTYRWEELGEPSAGASPSKPDIPSPKKRKMKRWWTPLEEDTLRMGVKKFGKGNWKLIQHAYRDVFQGRSEVDLKDKWRNMTR